MWWITRQVLDGPRGRGQRRCNWHTAQADMLTELNGPQWTARPGQNLVGKIRAGVGTRRRLQVDGCPLQPSALGAGFVFGFCSGFRLSPPSLHVVVLRPACACVVRVPIPAAAEARRSEQQRHILEETFRRQERAQTWADIVPLLADPFWTKLGSNPAKLWTSSTDTSQSRPTSYTIWTGFGNIWSGMDRTWPDAHR